MPEINYRAKLRTVLPENVEDESIARPACGKRGADVRPDFRWHLKARVGPDPLAIKNPPGDAGGL